MYPKGVKRSHSCACTCKCLYTTTKASHVKRFSTDLMQSRHGRIYLNIYTSINVPGSIWILMSFDRCWYELTTGVSSVSYLHEPFRIDLLKQGHRGSVSSRDGDASCALEEDIAVACQGFHSGFPHLRSGTSMGWKDDRFASIACNWH